MKIIFTLLLSLVLTLISAQQKTLAKFTITDASINNSDITETYLDAGGYIVFYTKDDGNLYMANVIVIFPCLGTLKSRVFC
jgi:hypothetical protein